MRFIPTTAHGLADYIVGLMVMGLPFLFGWTGATRVTFASLGILVICYSLLTDYEFGLIRVFRIRFHLLLDACSVSPCSWPRRCSVSRMILASSSA
jgi:hypothetical protein